MFQSRSDRRRRPDPLGAPDRPARSSGRSAGSSPTRAARRTIVDGIEQAPVKLVDENSAGDAMFRDRLARGAAQPVRHAGRALGVRRHAGPAAAAVPVPRGRQKPRRATPRPPASRSGSRGDYAVGYTWDAASGTWLRSTDGRPFMAAVRRADRDRRTSSCSRSTYTGRRRRRGRRGAARRAGERRWCCSDGIVDRGTLGAARQGRSRCSCATADGKPIAARPPAAPGSSCPTSRTPSTVRPGAAAAHGCHHGLVVTTARRRILRARDEAPGTLGSHVRTPCHRNRPGQARPGRDAARRRDHGRRQRRAGPDRRGRRRRRGDGARAGPRRHPPRRWRRPHVGPGDDRGDPGRGHDPGDGEVPHRPLRRGAGARVARRRLHRRVRGAHPGRRGAPRRQVVVHRRRSCAAPPTSARRCGASPRARA